jgi:diguanylate cyclase (GGDEF)-like protein
MATWDISGSLIRMVVLFGAMAGVPFLRRWAGGPLRAYLVVFGGVLFMFAWEGTQLYNLAARPDFHVADIAWKSVSVQATGYIFILLGLLWWIRDLRLTRNELQRSNAALQQVAATDFLTGLLTRRQASFLLDFETARARRSGLPLGFIMIDIDHFKEVNDTHGHQAGDAVLVHIGKLLKSRLRSSDIVSRYGGEEFLVLVTEAGYAATVDLANDLRVLIEQNPVTHEDVQIPVRASFGVVVSHVDGGDSAHEAIKRADAALYAAKARGRNRVVSWEDIAEKPPAAISPPKESPALTE